MSVLNQTVQVAAARELDLRIKQIDMASMSSPFGALEMNQRALASPFGALEMNLRSVTTTA